MHARVPSRRATTVTVAPCHGDGIIVVFRGELLTKSMLGAVLL